MLRRGLELCALAGVYSPRKQVTEALNTPTGYRYNVGHRSDPNNKIHAYRPLA